MANFAGLLKKTIDAQENPTPDLRARVYARARETVVRKLAETGVSPTVAEAQLQALDDAIKSVEADYVAVEQELLSNILVKKPEAQSSLELNPVSSSDKLSRHGPEPKIEESGTGKSEFGESGLNASEKVAPSTAPIFPAGNTADNPDRLVGEASNKTAEQTALKPETGSSAAVEIGRTQNFERNNHQTSGHPVGNEDKNGDLREGAPAFSRQSVFDHDKTPPSTIDEGEQKLEKGDEEAAHSSLHQQVPDAEPVNMEDIIAAEKEAEKEKAEQELQSAKALGNNQQNGDYDIVSDIFVQAARRTERRAARKKAIVIGLSSAVVIIVVVGVLLTAWSFLSGRNKSHDAEQHVAGNTNTSELPKEKFTQRLLADGSEVDEGPAQSPMKPGEGTSTSAGTIDATTPQEQPGEATFYQARTDQQDEKVETGTVQWSIVKDKANSQGREEIAVRGNVTIPDEKLSLRLTLRRNTDPSLPAAYLIEAIFIVPDDFEGKAIDNVHELTFKDSEQAPGQQLTGTVEAKIDDDFFLFALSGANPFRDRNLQLMKQLGWIRLVITDKNKRVSELTFSKGPNGEAVFNQVIDSWLDQNNKPTLYDQKQTSDKENASVPSGDNAENNNALPQDNPENGGQSGDSADVNSVSPTNATEAPESGGQNSTNDDQSGDAGEEDTE
ncbi:unnamed protein product [Bartonella apihabitans]|uniref:hypothetical protein n=1 Tax=Bartonella apihabitans TaxID=2750929 RepID=UPI003998C766